MRSYCLALAFIAVLIVTVQSQECCKANTPSLDRDQFIDKAKSPLNITMTVDEADCNASVRFGTSRKEAAKLEICNITVENSGDVPLNDVIVFAEMAKGMKFENSSYQKNDRGRLVATRDPLEFDERRNTSLKWDIGVMQAKEIKSILLEAYIKCYVNEMQIKVTAFGYAPDNMAINTSQEDVVVIRRCDFGENNCTTPEENDNRLIKDIDITSQVFEANSNTRAVFGVGNSEPAKEEIYKITVTNNGDLPLNDVIVFALMAEGMMFKNTAYFDPTRGKLNVERDPIVFDENVKTKLIWNIGDLQPEETKSILLEAYIKCCVNNALINATNALINVTVEGYTPGNKLIPDSVDKTLPVECTARNDRGEPCTEVHIATGLCKMVCPNWKIQ
jgi:hypothetical protein